ncbi:MAG: hypothetical protein RH945_10095 [Hyphomonas sp.]|nr:transposase family protein [Alphaproteobacteria bacterium]
MTHICEGSDVGKHLVFLHCRGKGACLPAKRPRRDDLTSHQEARCQLSRPNEAWSTGFVHVPLYDGCKISTLNIIDAFTRLVPAIDFRGTYAGADIAETLERVCSKLELSGSIRGRTSPGKVVIPENKRLENWTSPALIIDGDENEEIAIHRRAYPCELELNL